MQDWKTAVGRRVVPNLLSKDLFQKIDFFKYITEDEKRQRLPWLRKAKVRCEMEDLNHE